jgi:hypothetical protein
VNHINCTGYTCSAEPIAGEQQVVRIYVCKEEMSCNPFPGKAGIKFRSNFENLRAVYLWTHNIYSTFFKFVSKWRQPNLR